MRHFKFCTNKDIVVIVSIIVGECSLVLQLKQAISFCEQSQAQWPVFFWFHLAKYLSGKLAKGQHGERSLSV